MPAVYIVDDDDEDCDLVMKAFAKSNIPCRIRLFSNGLDLFRTLEHTSPPEFPSFILLDLNMPIMNGFETLEKLRADSRYRTIPVLVLSSSSYPDDIVQSYDLGGNAYLRKPHSFRTLVEMINLTSQYWLRSARTPIHRLN
ncbi:response regulator [Larkinella soli]|uniref:response regulator n=1 Tax=Larkinella soli TaxID=1770527 RepID=UPI0013E3866E|nr:response regulator [Larkinella soli]